MGNNIDIAAPALAPSKWDIIPLHTSDRATFKQCRRRWHWSSPAQMNLIQKPQVYGIYQPFWFGTGVHYALEHFYNPVLKEDPETAFDTWFDIQWNGGIIKETELDHFEDRIPWQNEAGVWNVPGLVDILPFPDDESWEEHHQLGLAMMRNYKEYADREDDFRVVSSEHLFSVPVLDPATGNVLYMRDTREMPEGWEPNYDLGNKYGPLYQEGMKQVHARGRMDLIVQSNKTERYVIIDHKTVGHALDESYFRHTDLDEQCTTYTWAAEQEARMHDLEYKDIAGIVYQALRKAAPKAPTILKSGLPSVNRQTESTTARLFEKTIDELGLRQIYESDVKMQQYYTYLCDLGDRQYIWRESVVRNKSQKESAGYRLYLEALDMLDPNLRIYPNPSKDYTCINCIFRQPCIGVEAGYDWQGMIADNYVTNYDR